MKNKGLVKKLSTTALSLFVVGVFATGGASRPAYAMIEDKGDLKKMWRLASKWGTEEIKKLKKINSSSSKYAILDSSKKEEKPEKYVNNIKNFIELSRKPENNLSEEETNSILAFCNSYAPPSSHSSFPQEKLLYAPLTFLYIEKQRMETYIYKKKGDTFMALGILRELNDYMETHLRKADSYFSKNKRINKFYKTWQDDIQAWNEYKDEKYAEKLTKQINEYEKTAKYWIEEMKLKFLN